MIGHWAFGASWVGRHFPGDLYLCAGCGRRILKSDPPVGIGDRVMCGDCHIARHLGCPCLMG